MYLFLNSMILLILGFSCSDRPVNVSPDTNDENFFKVESLDNESCDYLAFNVDMSGYSNFVGYKFLSDGDTCSSSFGYVDSLVFNDELLVDLMYLDNNQSYTLCVAPVDMMDNLVTESAVSLYVRKNCSRYDDDSPSQSDDCW